LQFPFAHRLESMQNQRLDWLQNTKAFLRSNKKMTYRKRAMRLLKTHRYYVEHDMDEQDRIYQERLGKDELDFKKVNPHRVQLFSINEIWRCLKGKLVELNVIRDMDVLSVQSEHEESDELPDSYDFLRLKKLRLKNLFSERHDQERHLTSVRKLLKRNDIKFVNSLAEQVCCSKEEIKKLDARSDDFDERVKWMTLQEQKRTDKTEELQQQIKDLMEMNQHTLKTFTKFRDFKLPKILDEAH
jgi:hypothetical protein